MFQLKNWCWLRLAERSAADWPPSAVAADVGQVRSGESDFGGTDAASLSATRLSSLASRQDHRAAAAEPEYVESYGCPLASRGCLALEEQIRCSSCAASWTLAKNAANSCLGVGGLSAPTGAPDVGLSW